METSIHTIYFSPAHSTRSVVREVARGMSDSTIDHDITQGLPNPITLCQNDIVVIGVPCYSGRVPDLATKYLSTIEGRAATAVLVCVYGNREFEDTLLELKNTCIKQGFRVISAGAFIARHSIFPNIAQGRPNERDMATARRFGAESLDLIRRGFAGELFVSGNSPYRQIGKIPIAPKGTSRCTKCGVCSAGCPVGAIDKLTPRKTDKTLCIACGRCIELCPIGARKYRGVIYKLAQSQFTKKFSRPKEIELFVPRI